MTPTAARIQRARARASGVRDLVEGLPLRLRSRVSSVDPDGHPPGVNLIGYYLSALGIGEATRGMLAALETTGLPVAPVHVRAAPGVRRSAGLTSVPVSAAPFGLNVIHAGGDGVRGLVRRHGPALLRGRRSVGVWWWEVLPGPATWNEPSRWLDEIWVGSDHVLEALAPVVDVPIRKIPQAVPAPTPSRASRAALGLPEGFVFLTSFDYASTVARKNPAGVIAAFRRAFPTRGEAHLVIRSINGSRHPRERRLLERLAAEGGDVTLIDGYLSPADKDAALAHCDCFVSLHRAEGFGLPLAEAMRLGTPVIATRWSGNLEFMTDENASLVDASIVEIGPGGWPYPPSGRWAEPDLDDAARCMREVLDEPGEAARRARRGAEDVRRGHDPRVVGRFLADALARLDPRLAG